jgi:uncharacterized protein YbjQ (UPF0145 family)
MITSTLSAVPGHQFFEILGVVGGIGSDWPPSASAAWQDARHQLEVQAEALGADAVIDVRFEVVPLAAPATLGVLVSVSGTAIKFSLQPW